MVSLFTPDGRELMHAKTHIFPAESEWKTAEGDELEVWDLGPARTGVAICYETEIPEVIRILAYRGAEVILCPSFTLSEAGFWRVRHCAQARCIENQIYFVHCCAIGDAGAPLPSAYGRSSILSPCDRGWNPSGIVVEADVNQPMVISARLDLDALHDNRETGAATTFHDRTRRAAMYGAYAPYRSDLTSDASEISREEDRRQRRVVAKVTWTGTESCPVSGERDDGAESGRSGRGP